MCFLRLGVKAGKDSLPFAIFVVQNHEKWIYENASALYAPGWKWKTQVFNTKQEFYKMID